jgi:hypothetical protein
MKKLNLFLLGAITMGALTFGACKKEKGCTDKTAKNYKASAKENDNSCEYEGEVIFWNHQNDGLGFVDIYVSGAKIGTITVDKTSSPSCGTSGCVTWKNKPGNYTYEAREQGTGDVWTGTFAIDKNTCLAFRLSQ